MMDKNKIEIYVQVPSEEAIRATNNILAWIMDRDHNAANRLIGPV